MHGSRLREQALDAGFDTVLFKPLRAAAPPTSAPAIEDEPG